MIKNKLIAMALATFFSFSPPFSAPLAEMEKVMQKPNIQAIQKPKVQQVQVQNRHKEPVSARIGKQKVLVYEFSPKKTMIDFIYASPREIKHFGFFLGRAEKEYGKRLEFVTTANFYDVKTQKLVGRIKNLDGKIFDENMNTKNNASVMYKNDVLRIVDNTSGDYLTYSSGLLYLLKERKAKKDAIRAGVEAYAKRPRSALGVRENGNGILFFATCNIPELISISKQLKCKDAVIFDAGGSRAFYASQIVHKRENSGRGIKAVMVGIKNY